MNNDTAALLATAAAKSAALNGLSDALEYGNVNGIRINGTMTVTAAGRFGTFRLTVDNVGTVRCRGYVVSSTCRDLTYDYLRTRA